MDREYMRKKFKEFSLRRDRLDQTFSKKILEIIFNSDESLTLDEIEAIRDAAFNDGMTLAFMVLMDNIAFDDALEDIINQKLVGGLLETQKKLKETMQ